MQKQDRVDRHHALGAGVDSSLGSFESAVYLRKMKKHGVQIVKRPQQFNNLLESAQCSLTKLQPMLTKAGKWPEAWAIKGIKPVFLFFDQLLVLHQTHLSRLKELQKFKTNWSSAQMDIMFNILAQFNTCETRLDPEQALWERVAGVLPGRTCHDCMFKFLSLKPVPVKAHPWSRQQDRILSALVTDEKPDWLELSKQLYLKNSDQDKIYRTGKQCREHFNCKLDQGIKHNKWSEYEDNLLLKLHMEHGRRWASMTSALPGRNQNSIKNRFSMLTKNDLGIQDISFLEIKQRLKPKEKEKIRRKQQKKLSFQEQISPVSPVNSNEANLSSDHFTVLSLLTEFRSFSLSIDSEGSLSVVVTQINDLTHL